MAENSISSIKNGLIVAVLSGLIVYDLTLGDRLSLKPFSWAWSGLAWLQHEMITPYTLSGWTLLILIFLSLIGILAIFLKMKPKTHDSKKSADLKRRSYVQDTMHGALWRWYWVGNKIVNLWAYCPVCDATLVYDDSSCRRSIYRDEEPHTRFICEHCGHTVIARVFGGNRDYAISAVTREIDRRIRTGEYEQTLPVPKD